jgi:hypothetical protein
MTDEDYNSLSAMASKIGTTPTTMARVLVLVELGGVNPVTLAQLDRRSTAFFTAILERLLSLVARQNGKSSGEAREIAQEAAAQISSEIERSLEKI